MKIIFLSFLLLFVAMECFAHLPNKTNINEVTTLFEDNVERKDEFIGEINAIKESGINGIKSKEAESMIPDIGASGQESGRLSSMRAHDLDNAGRTKRTSEECKFYDANSLELDYSSARVQREKEDIDEILAARDKDVSLLNGKLEELTKGLKEFEIDCQTEKGAIEKEPEFHVDIKREEQKNTEYDQFFCEKPRNTYNCTDTMTITCLQRNWSIQWKDVGAEGMRTMDFTIGELDAKGWWYGVYWKKKRYGVHMKGDASTKEQVRTEIAKKLKMKIGHIHEDVQISARGNGSPNHNIREKHYAWGSYRVTYKFREGEETCDKWSEPDWTERCHIK